MEYCELRFLLCSEVLSTHRALEALTSLGPMRLTSPLGITCAGPSNGAVDKNPSQGR